MIRVERPHMWIAAFSVAAVLGVAIVDLRRTSPGPLTAVHGREPDLEGRSCSECHGGWTSTMTESCLECHAAIAEHIETGNGLHGVIGAEANKCASCHSEHHGPSFALVNRQSFARAGVEDPEAFEHERIGFAMDGKHLELTCTECHQFADTRVLEAGTFRYLGLDQDCSTCHEDVHEGRMSFGCAQCHGQHAFEELESAGHEEHLALTGGHGDLDCRACHAEGDPHGLESLGKLGAPPARTCLDCHQSPHAGSFIEGIARFYSVTDGASCGVCHEAEHLSFVEETIEVTAAQHALSGFPLGVPHDQVGCAECHGTELGEDFASRFPGRGKDECAACHVDPHEGQFDDPAYAAGCIACHDRHRFEPHAFGEEEHARTALPLEASHLELDCAACHVDPPEGRARRFADTDATCAACHEDAHQGLFERVSLETERAVAAANCGTCHVSTTFDDVDVASFEHGAWTGFPVDGAHAFGHCETCHERSEHPDDLGRRFGRVHELFGPFHGCETCHEDPHRGSFDEPSLPSQVAGREGCARCHTTASFRALAGDFDHEAWTGFSLYGRHAEVGCSSCHPALRRPDEEGRTWERARGQACGDCHVDPHAGQFDTFGLAPECERCHASSVAFSDLAFRHDRDSVFELGEAHETLDCGACHKPEALPGGGSMVRYKPLGTECADCHGVQESVLRKKRGKK